MLYTGSVSLAIDSTGRPYVTYCSQKLTREYVIRYAHPDDNDWTVETVDGEGCWYSTALAIDDQGIVHLAFYSEERQDSTSGVLKYGRLLQDGWAIEVVDDTGDTGEQLSLALGSDGTPHISYTHRPADCGECQTALKYAHRVGNTWQMQVIDSSVGMAINIPYLGKSSLALDQSGNPYVVYFDGEPGLLTAATLAGNEWSSIGFDRGIESVIDLALALDDNNQPHVTYSAGLPTGPVYKQQRYATGQRVTLSEQFFLPIVSK